MLVQLLKHAFYCQILFEIRNIIELLVSLKLEILLSYWCLLSMKKHVRRYLDFIQSFQEQYLLKPLIIFYEQLLVP